MDILIVGGGFTGVSAAAALADGRRRITILEARAGKNPRFNGELIHPTGVAVLDELGLLPELAKHGGVPVQGFAVVPSPTEDAVLLPYREIPGARPDGFAMDHHEMVARMRAAVVRRPGVELRTGERVVDVLREGERVVGVRTADGTERRADLVLVAEGRHSRLRPMLGIEEEAHLLSFTAAVFVEGVELPNPGYGHIFLGAWGPILAYAIGPGQVRMCIDLPTDMDKGKDAVVRRIREEYAPYVPEPLRSGMLASLDSRALEMCATHAIYTQRCSGPGFALLGDAGGCSHPLTAAGMTICLTDIKTLVGELEAGASPGPAAVDAAVARYQKNRYRFVRAREILADALYEVFRGAEDGTRAIRHGIFRYWSGSARARAASMALLSGHDSRLHSFLGEYLRVVAQSVSGALRGQVNDPSLAGRARSLAGLARKSFEKLEKVVASVKDGSLR